MKSFIFLFALILLGGGVKANNSEIELHNKFSKKITTEDKPCMHYGFVVAEVTVVDCNNKPVTLTSSVTRSARGSCDGPEAIAIRASLRQEAEDAAVESLISQLKALRAPCNQNNYTEE